MEATIRSKYPHRYFEQKVNLFCCCRKNGKVYFDLLTVAHSRRGSMAKLFQHDSRTWKQCRKDGWRCVKVNVLLLGQEDTE